MGLSIVNTATVKGVTALAQHLKGVEDKWIKINRFRDNCETWHHQDWEHSRFKLDELAGTFGGLKEHVIFVIQDAIKSEDGQEVVEIGYDGWTVNGEFPGCSFQGFESKNELYLGSLLEYEDLPEQVRAVNEAMAPTLARYGYRNFIATELRIKGDETYFIDPTMRMPGQTGEHLLETCSNLADVIWKGANGELIRPEFTHRFAAEATVHYTAGSDGWKVLRIPDEARRCFKGYHYCESDGLYHFPPHKTDEVGVIIGQGNTIEASIEDLKANFELLEGEPVKIELAAFAGLIKEINASEELGLEFTEQPIPEPSIVIES
jgi:hypothetical protein